MFSGISNLNFSELAFSQSQVTVMRRTISRARLLEVQISRRAIISVTFLILSMCFFIWQGGNLALNALHNKTVDNASFKHIVYVFSVQGRSYMVISRLPHSNNHVLVIRLKGTSGH